MSKNQGFPNPHEIPTIPGTEGWERMYPYYYTFTTADKEMETHENNLLWFYDGLHYPQPMYPFDLIWDEAWYVALSQNNSRIFSIPASMGIDHRIINGYIYIAPVSIEDPAIIGPRVEEFMKRAGYYYENWDELYEKWKVKVTDIIKTVEGIEFDQLPELEKESVVTEGKGMSSGFELVRRYNELINYGLEAWQYHFEFLNLAYASYVILADFCKKLFPGMEDRTLAKMVGGVDVILFKPDENLRNLAKLAMELGLNEKIRQCEKLDDALSALSESDTGKEWLKAFEDAKYPWFYMSTGTGWYHDHWTWFDRIEIPFGAIKNYIEMLEKGESVERPIEQIIETKERLVEEYTNLITTEEDRATFQKLLGVSQTCFPYLEDHNFYIEHWFHGVFWEKIRALSKIFVSHNFFDDVEDIWYLNRYELEQALYDLVTSWATGVKPRGPSYWPQEIEWRKGVIEKFREFSPPPALGATPETITEPFTIMLWGITTDSMNQWLEAGTTDSGDVSELKGYAASPGVAEGKARVVRSPDDIVLLQEGEILVASTTSPSWTPVFNRIGAAITDVGGIMSHAAIVCREYGLPAVVGTGFGTKAIKTGQIIKVDGDKGTVTIIK
ncbi:MAG: PEP-utilizing enzyme [Bacillota bacterium]|nr:PEP-utilizing enzyme [Bacillota bacterium]